MAVDTMPLFGGGKYYVYLYRDPRPRKRREPIYIGKGSAARGRADHHWRWPSSMCLNPILRGKLAKIKAAGLEPVIEIVDWFSDEEEAFALERVLIKRFGRINLGTGSLCNLTDGGDGTSGAILNEEQRAAISKRLLGRKFSPETIERLKASHAGQKRSAETIEKYRAAMAAKKASGWKRPPRKPETVERHKAAMQRRLAEGRYGVRKGIPHTAETKAKISASRKGKGVGRVMPRDDVERRAAKRRGKKMSAEARENMRQAQLRYHARRRSKSPDEDPGPA